VTKVVFETASLADAVREAAAVAPSRGEAFDKSAGIVLEIQDGVVVVKASDLRLWYMQWITPISVEGKPVEWRVPSRVFSEVITKLPMGSQTRLTLEQTGSVLSMTHGRKRGRFNLMDMESYQRWMPFDPDGMTDAENLAASLSRVDWATSKGNNPPFTGVHITGEALVASDRTKFATVPLKIEGLDRPVTVPSGLLNRVVKNTDLPRIRVEENHLLVMPDDHTQIKCVIYGVDYPDIGRVTVRDRPEYIKIGKSLLLDAMQVAASFIEGDRLPIMRTFWGAEEIAVMLENQESGHLGDVIDIPGQATHERVEIKFAPENIMGALDHCPAQEIIIGYDPGKLTRPIYINGGDGCEFWVAPTRGVPSDA
jgi:DNA polymerase III sliding clamp (beta) subunit (PCNA family)